MKCFKHRVEVFTAVCMRAIFKIMNALGALKSNHDSEKLVLLIEDFLLNFSKIFNILT